ncbi:MAG: DUF1848 family protein [Candidatus Lokiarchaeota archaeon]|nr:DUF1848 family protein [Candidatus Lokiarchaeota archaeon]
MRQIISFSRRTDGPAFYMDKFKKAIKEETISVQNPFNQKEFQVSLKPNDVAGFVFWSKDFRNFLKNWQILLKYIPKTLFGSKKNIPVYFQFTRNSVVRILEPNTPSLEESYSQLEEIIEITSPKHIMWRFDPIVFWKEDDLLFNNLNDFREIASHFAEFGIDKCTISFVTYYPKVQKRLKKYSFQYYKINNKEMIKTAKRLIDITNNYKIKIYACCNPDLLNINGISQAHCINGDFLEKLWDLKLSKAKDLGQRKDCGCTKSRDIGGYGKEWKCNHSCLYCYANR